MTKKKEIIKILYKIKTSLFIWCIALAVGLLGNYLINEVWFPRPRIPLNYFTFYGIPIIGAAPSILLVGLAVGLTFHGITIIRR